MSTIRIIARWAPQSVPRGGVAPGQNLFPFDPTSLIGDPHDSAGNPGGPGYVFHCHILDHEDNEMRPYAVSDFAAARREFLATSLAFRPCCRGRF